MIQYSSSRVIVLRISFTSDMESLCNDDRTISRINPNARDVGSRDIH